MQQSKTYTNPKVRYNTVISNTYGPPPQVHRYSNLQPLNSHDHNVLEHDEDNELHELTSTGTPDTEHHSDHEQPFPRTD